MSRKPEPRDDSMALGDGFARWVPGTNGYDQGTIFLPEGVVDAMMQGDDRNYHLTRLDTVIDGRLVMRSFDKRYSRRGVIRLARELLSENTDAT